MRERGIEIPGENASDDELVEFNALLVKLMEDEEKAGNGDFKGYTKLMERLDDEYYVNSLSRIEEIAPGYPSWRGYPGNGVYSPSLKITVYECERCFYPTRSGMAMTGANVSDERAKDYVARLSGRTVKEDLRLALLNNWIDAGKALDATGHVEKTWDDDDTKTNPNHKKYEDNYMATIGMGIKGSWTKSKWRLSSLLIIHKKGRYHMNDKDTIKKTGQPEENEAAKLDIGQLDQVSGGDRDGGHKPPTNPFKPKVPDEE